MNLQQIQYILAVAEFKNFSKAAEKCFITQSTLSTMISRFEDEIGISIFDRKTKPASVTKEGEVIIQQFKLITSEIGNLHEIIDSLKGESTGSLKIGVIPTIAPYILPLFLEEYTRSFPRVNFEISEITTASILKGLKDRELDIGIVSTPLEEENIIEHPLYEEDFVVYDTQLNKHKPTTVNEIDRERLWLLEEGHCLRTQVEIICDFDQKSARPGSNFQYKSGTIDSLMRFVKNNKGLTFLPYLATLDFNASELQKISSLNAPTPARTIGLVVHKHFIKKKLLEQLKRIILQKVVPLVKNTKNKKRQIIPPNKK